MRHLISRDNAHFRELKKLCHSGRERRKSGRIVLDGVHLIESYCAVFGTPQEVVVSEAGMMREEIARLVTEGGAGMASSLKSWRAIAESTMLTNTAPINGIASLK